MHKRKLFRKIIYVICIAMLSLVCSLIINNTYINLLTSSSKILTLDNFDTLKNNLNSNDIVEVSGTIDQLNLFKDDSDNIYAALKEYGNKIIINFKSNRVSFDKIKFVGKIIKLSDISSSAILLSKFNSSINTSDLNNSNITKDLNSNTIQKISLTSKTNFDNNTFILFDGVYFNKKQIYINLSIFSIIIFIGLLIIFRKYIF